MAKRFVWVCPECKEKTVLYVKASEVTCANKQAHTSRSVPMICKSPSKSDA